MCLDGDAMKCFETKYVKDLVVSEEGSSCDAAKEDFSKRLKKDEKPTKNGSVEKVMSFKHVKGKDLKSFMNKADDLRSKEEFNNWAKRSLLKIALVGSGIP